MQDSIKDVYFDTLLKLKEGIKVKHLVRKAYQEASDKLVKTIDVLLPTTYSRINFDFKFKNFDLRKMYPEQVIIFQDELVEVSLVNQDGEKTKTISGIVRDLRVNPKEWLFDKNLIDKMVTIEFKLLKTGNLRLIQEENMNMEKYVDKLISPLNLINKIKLSTKAQERLNMFNLADSFNLKDLSKIKWPYEIKEVIDLEYQIESLSSDYLSNEDIKNLKDEDKKYQIESLREWLKENA